MTVRTRIAQYCMGATVACGRRQHDTQRRVRQGPPAPPPAPSSVEAVTSSGLGRCLPRSRQPARRLPARRGPGARLCHSSATSGLARHAVVAVPAGPRRPPLPARAAPRLGPARSSAGAWPHQDARRRPRTGTPSETLQPISPPERLLGLTTQVANVPEHLGVSLLLLGDAVGEGGLVCVPSMPHRPSRPVKDQVPPS
jgi:hypothetical protein